LLAAYRALRPNKHADRLEAAFLIADIRCRQKTPAESSDSLLTEALAKITDLPATLDELGSANQKRAIAALKTHRPDLLRANLQNLDAKLLDEIPEVLTANAGSVAQSVQNHVAGLEMLLWLCRAYTSPKAPAWLDQVPGPALLSAVVSAIESAEYKSTTKRLRDQLFNDDALITELLAAAPPDVIRAHARALLASSAFEELDRRSLMARLVKEFPFVQELLVSRTAKEAPLIVSWPSLRRRQAELEDLVQKRIPQNSREISEARSYGDLRENFEYKAAKDTQKVLMRRRAELEVLLSRSQGTDFAEAKTDTVNIGTTVVATDLGTGKQLTYHVLGAWDSDPARGIISYPAGLAQVLLNKPAGETVEFAGEHGPQRLRIERIEKVAPDLLQAL
jgi:transcription elongation GreA/GreB family factor